jgi:hypothetical protein
MTPWLNATLRHWHRVLASATVGVTKLRGAAYIEIYFSLLRVLALGVGTELTGQRLLDIAPHFVSATDKVKATLILRNVVRVC